MEEFVDLSIPHTETRKKPGIFNSSYTVYQLKIILDDSYQYFLLKRYKEFRKLHDIVKETLNHEYKFPKFPGRTLNPMSAGVIIQRKCGLEKWLLVALTYKKVEIYLKDFLEIKDDYLQKTSEIQVFNEDEVVIKEFSGKINENTHCRISLLDDFDKRYFSRRRSVRGKIIEQLVATIVPLCGDDYIGSKSLDFLYKLCTSDYNRDFELFTKELVNMPIELLKKMKLDEYLLKKRFCDSQIQAFYILNVLKTQFDVKSINEILNNDSEAQEIIAKWDCQGCLKSNTRKILSVTPDWRTIHLSDLQDDMQISYRFINNQLQINAVFLIQSNFSTIINILTQPEYRKKWDLKLIEIEEIERNDDGIGLIMLYSHERTIYEFHNIVEINKSIYHTTINFHSKKFNHIKTKGILGEVNNFYKLEKIAKSDSTFSFDITDHDVTRVSSCKDFHHEVVESKFEVIKVTWKATFCEISKKMFVSDCLEETETLKHTIGRLVHLAENPLEHLEKSPKNMLLKACERKKLKKLGKVRKMSTQDDFN
ncbi:hypothetical protein SteCoe_7093 [Stentor coeruleus]|uniref:PX domain-containing protein n=1 Tax=Stentor coeruleus TaxID=5963 RepID=A0A1R2CNG2_9CILI|nr:hypothetical protein SteCoe_7093 [Stentor coeruleus]